MFTFMESLVLTIIYVFKSRKSFLQIIDLISDHLIFLGSVDIIGHLEAAYLKDES